MNIHITATVKRPVSLPITPYEGEPRVLDTALAAQLGISEPAMIRRLIKAHMDELLAFGVLSSREITSGTKGGRPGTAYYLNRQQALLICILSKTDKAKEVRAEVIRRFDAFEELTRPAPVPVPALPTTYREALVALLEKVEENEVRAEAVEEGLRLGSTNCLIPLN